MSSYRLYDLLSYAVEKGASDLHLTAGVGPILRLNSKLVSIEELGVSGEEILTPEHTEAFMTEVLSSEQIAVVNAKGQLDFSYSIFGLARFRVNCYRQRGSYALAFRVLYNEMPVLEKLGIPSIVGDLSLKKRGLILVTGPTGSGKSTIINLIPRFYDVSRGSIEINGVDIRDVKQSDLLENIGYIPQKGLLFSGDIASNLRIGKPDATEEEMVEALKTAQAYDFVMEKEDGLKSSVSQGGKNFSGGQRQRLCIARAIIKKPKIYIFDDSFSALDYQTDRKLRSELKKQTKDAINFIVAQRIGTIMNADQIIVLDQGRAVGIGSHKSLLKDNKVYQEMAYSQLSKEELENASL